jgi:hypothetical protein
MFKQIPRPLIRHVDHDEAGASLDRLITAASSDTGGAARVADFLLSWWDGASGAFRLIDICNVDAETAEDMLVILAYLAQNGVTYADAWGRRADMERLIDAWDWKGQRSA